VEIYAVSRKREEVIEKWMTAIIDDGGIRRFDDLHIDEIDSAWSHRDRWVEGGLESFRCALAVRDQNRLPFAVALAFSLKSGDRPIGVDFQSRPDLQERFDRSPPSLYLFHRGEELRNRMGSNEVARDLNPVIFGISEPGISCYYLEFLQKGTDEYCRSVSLEG